MTKEELRKREKYLIEQIKLFPTRKWYNKELKNVKKRLYGF